MTTLHLVLFISVCLAIYIAGSLIYQNFICKHLSFTSSGWIRGSDRWLLWGKCDRCGKRELVDFEPLDSPRGKQMEAAYWLSLDADDPDEA